MASETKIRTPSGAIIHTGFLSKDVRGGTGVKGEYLVRPTPSGDSVDYREVSGLEDRGGNIITSRTGKQTVNWFSREDILRKIASEKQQKKIDRPIFVGIDQRVSQHEDLKSTKVIIPEKPIKDDQGRDVIGVRDKVSKQTKLTPLKERELKIIEGQRYAEKLPQTHPKPKPQPKKQTLSEIRPNTIEAQKYSKDIKGAIEKQRTITRNLIHTSEADKSFTKRTLASLGLIGMGAVRGVSSMAELVRYPITTVKGTVQSMKPANFRGAMYGLGEQLKRDPLGTATEFYIYQKSFNKLNSMAKRSRVGRFVAEEIFIAKQPKKFQPYVRAYIEGMKAQEKIKPSKKVTKVDFANVQSLTKIEAKALKKALQQTDSFVFGSKASDVLTGSKTPTPKDVDLATKSVDLFNKQFMKNLPKSARANLIVKGQKITRAGTGETVLDVKPMDRLRPNFDYINRKGYLPVTGYDKKIVYSKGDQLTLPKYKNMLREGKLEIPTQKTITVDGIKFTQFSEQVIRKGLGSLQYLLEKNVRRAKDLASFINNLEVQLQHLKATNPITPVGKLSKTIKEIVIRDSLRTLKEGKVPAVKDIKGIKGVKDLPTGKRVTPLEEKLVNLEAQVMLVKAKKGKGIKTNNEIIRLSQRIKQTKADIYSEKIFNANTKTLKKVELQKPKKITTSTLNKPSTRSYIPLSKIKPSKIPIAKFKSSNIPLSSKVPLSKIPSSKIPSSDASQSKQPNSKIPGSKLPPSQIPPSQVPPSVLPPTLIPPSQIPPSQIPPSQIPPPYIPPSRIPPSRLPPSKIPPPKIPPQKEFIYYPKDKYFKQLSNKVTGKKPQVLKFTTTVVRPNKPISKKKRLLRLYTGAELR